MQRSTERFLTTHTGSLPRPDDLVRMMYAQGGRRAGRTPTRSPQRVASAVAEVVRKQARGRHRRRQRRRDEQAELRDVHQGPAERLRRRPATRSSTRISPTFRGSRSACSAIPAARAARRPRATRRSACAIRRPRGPTSRICRPRCRASTVQEAFLTAASPGVVSLFFRNEHYPSDEAYLSAIAEAMREEYETIARAGIVLQIDCPDLGMGRHIQYADLSLAEFRKKAELHVEALNHALRNIPPEQLRMHLCWGNYEGPASLRRRRWPTSSTSCSARDRPPSRSRRRIRATRTSGSCSRRSSCPKARSHPRRHRIEVELHRASGADRAADRPLRESRRPRERDGRQRLRLRHVGRAGGRRSRRRMGEDGRDGGGCADRVARVLEEMSLRGAWRA